MPNVETPAAAGSRSRTAWMSPRSRFTVVNTLRLAAVRAVGAPLDVHAQRLERQQVDLQERIGHWRRGRGQQLDRLQRLQRADDARGGAEHAGLGARAGA